MYVKDITIVSLSSGILGEPFVRHEVEIGLARLAAYGVHVHFSKHAMAGLDFIAAHPEARAADLIEAFNSDTDMILCAIGGDDTYRLLPYLFNNDELKNAVSEKIFLGFSDTTMNCFMLHKVGLNCFYGQSFLPDICELGNEMPRYSRNYFEELLRIGRIQSISAASVWYESRTDFSKDAIGTPLIAHPNEGFRLLRGAPVFSGPILGGCIDTIFDMFDGTRYADSPALCAKYDLFPSLEDWKGRIFLLESGEEQADPCKYRRMIRALKSTGIFQVINGVLIGKPMNEIYTEAYNTILLEEIEEPGLSILTNINIGHAVPRCIIPFGVPAEIDAIAGTIRFRY